MKETKTKKKIGRPFKYTPEQLQKKVDEYFIYCEKEKKFPNVASLAIFLDLNRETVYATEKERLHSGLSNIIKKARLRIESLACERLNNNNSIGAMFYLKTTYNYRDKSEVEVKHKGNINVGLIRYEAIKNEDREN